MIIMYANMMPTSHRQNKKLCNDSFQVALYETRNWIILEEKKPRIEAF